MGNWNWEMTTAFVTCFFKNVRKYLMNLLVLSELYQLAYIDKI